MTPAEVVREAKKAGLAAVALSDHDTIDGVREAMEEGKRIGIEVVPAIEFSVQSETETHILAYCLDIDSPKPDRFSEEDRAGLEAMLAAFIAATDF